MAQSSIDDGLIHSTSNDERLARGESSRMLYNPIQYGHPMQYGCGVDNRPTYHPPGYGLQPPIATMPLPSLGGTNNGNNNFKPINVYLVDDKNMWSDFSKVGTEMIISKPGRHMFPTIKLQFDNLKSSQKYMVYLEILPVDKWRYKYERNGWMQKVRETDVQPVVLKHPLSPAEGSRWMEKPVDFPVKLTNSSVKTDEGTAYLRSMRKYSLQILVVQGNDDQQAHNSAKFLTFPLMKTTFIAVTTYQNQRVKDLKTELNVHAKGVRDKKLRYLQNFESENVWPHKSEYSRDTPQILGYDTGLPQLRAPLTLINPLSHLNKTYKPPTYYDRFSSCKRKLNFDGTESFVTPSISEKLPLGANTLQVPSYSECLPTTSPLSALCSLGVHMDFRARNFAPHNQTFQLYSPPQHSAFGFRHSTVPSNFCSSPRYCQIWDSPAQGPPYHSNFGIRHRTCATHVSPRNVTEHEVSSTTEAQLTPPVHTELRFEQPSTSTAISQNSSSPLNFGKPSSEEDSVNSSNISLVSSVG